MRECQVLTINTNAFFQLIKANEQELTVWLEGRTTVVEEQMRTTQGENKLKSEKKLFCGAGGTCSHVIPN